MLAKHAQSPGVYSQRHINQVWWNKLVSQEMEAEGRKFEVSQGYVRRFLKEQTTGKSGAPHTCMIRWSPEVCG